MRPKYTFIQWLESGDITVNMMSGTGESLMIDFSGSDELDIVEALEESLDVFESPMEEM